MEPSSLFASASKADKENGGAYPPSPSGGRAWPGLTSRHSGASVIEIVSDSENRLFPGASSGGCSCGEGGCGCSAGGGFSCADGTSGFCGASCADGASGVVCGASCARSRGAAINQ